MLPRRSQIFPLIYWVTLAGLFSFAAWQRFSLPLDPIADPDTWGYLAPGLRDLTTGNFGHQGRNFIYPGFLLVLLRLFGDFRAITIAQHLLGLAAAALLLLAWRRAYAFVVAPRLGTRSHAVIGLIAAAIFLVAGDSIRTEIQIRPEAVCAFVFSLNLWFAVKFSASTFIEKRRPSPVLGTGLVGTAVLLASLKPSFIFVAVIAMLPIVISFFRPAFFPQKIRLAISAAAGALLLVVPEYFLSRDDYTARMFLPTTLFVVHADIIRDQMADDLAQHAAVPYAPEWLRRVHDNVSEEISKSGPAQAGHYFLLGFSPDYLMDGDTSIAGRLAWEFEENSEALINFYRFYYWRTWRHRPFPMARKVIRQMALFYAPVCPAYDRSKILPLRDSYRLGVSSLDKDTYREVWKNYPPAVAFMNRVDSLAQNTGAIVQPRMTRGALAFLARAYLPLLFTTLAAAIATLFCRSVRERIGWLVAFTLFVFSYNAAACLEVAIINSLEVPRYSWVQMFVTLVAEFLALWLLFEFIFQRCSAPRNSPG
jgi:hypothetical protein